jgi:hypothetical protein
VVTTAAAGAVTSTTTFGVVGAAHEGVSHEGVSHTVVEAGVSHTGGVSHEGRLLTKGRLPNPDDDELPNPDTEPYLPEPKLDEPNPPNWLKPPLLYCAVAGTAARPKRDMKDVIK